METARTASGDSNPAEARKAAGPIRICLLGSQGAGKTCLLAGLAILGEPDRAGSHFHVKGADAETQSYLNELARSLRSREWPPPTNRTRLLRLDIRFKSRLMLLHVLDYLGEDFQTALHELDAQKAQEVWDHMLRADVLFLLVDPLTDLLPRVRGTRLTSEDEDNEKLLARLSALLNSLFEIFKDRGAGRPPAGPHLPDTAILLTKSDQVPELRIRKGRRARQYLEKRAPAFYKRMTSWAHKVRCFAISVPGNGIGLRDLAAGETAMPSPPGELHPIGYEELFDWIVGSRDRSRRRPLLQLVTRILAPVLILAFLGIGAVLYEQRSTQQQRHAAEQQINREIDNELEPRLDAATSPIEIDEILKRLEVLAERARDDRAASAAISRLSSEAIRKKEKIRFAQVEDARAARDPARFEKLADGFLEGFPAGVHAERVRAWLQEGREAAWKLHRNQVKALRCTGAATLLEKAGRIEEYVGRYPEEPNAQDIRKAAALARTLAESRSFTIELHSAGLFTTNRKFAVILELNQVEQHRFASEESTQSKTWEGASFQMEWKPGDRVRVSLEDLYLVDEPAAKVEEQGPLSLRLLSGKQALKIEPGWAKHLQGQPYVRFEVKGFSREDWVLLHNHVCPGNLW